jgi:hypothetical protein
MRYMLESPFGRWSEDGSRFVYDLDKVAYACGYTVDEVRAYGAVYCRKFPRTALSWRHARRPVDGKRG